MLRVLSDRPTRQPPRYLVEAAAVRFGEGFHDRELEAGEPFRWMSRAGSLCFDPSPHGRYLEVWVFSPFHDLSQVLTHGGGAAGGLRLPHGWSRVSLPVAPGGGTLELSVDRALPAEHHPGDARELAVRLRRPAIHPDETRHARVSRQHANAVANLEEMLAGAVRLDSTPPTLGIDMTGVCNVKPACVYCEWDYSKELEGEFVDAPFDLATLDEYAEFFEGAGELINCSIGEPFMLKDVDDLFDAFGDHGKILELTTNGQILTDRNIQKLVGRDIDLYISLDAATPETYAILRNDRFETILANLRRLVAAKGGRAGRPRIHLVFMPMRANLRELNGFLDLCAELDVDRAVLRPLNYTEKSELDWQRNGYHFVYSAELLPWATLAEASARAAARCRALGVELSDQMDFGDEGTFHERFHAGAPATAQALPTAPDAGGAAASEAPPAPEAAPAIAAEAPLPPLGAERLPVCQEPWKSLYILRRGTLPCCYGGEPLAAMDRYRETWNSPTLQAIRRDLLAGRFHAYCLNSPACPIVQKHYHGDALPVEHRGYMRLKSAWHAFERHSFGLGKLLYPIAKRAGAAALWTLGVLRRRRPGGGATGR